MFDAIVLAGGGSRRLHGQDKSAIEIGGRTLLDRVLDAVEAADRIVVVGPKRSTHTKVDWAREDPAGGGPLAGLAAGLAALGMNQRPTSPFALVLASDLPFAGPGVDRLLATALAATDGKSEVTMMVDHKGRDQYLFALWRATALQARVSEAGIPGVSMRSLFGGALVTRVQATDYECLDCDTPDDVDKAMALELARVDI